MFALSNNKYKIFIILCVLCIISIDSVVYADDSLTDLIDNVKMMNNYIYSFNCKLEYKYTLVDTIYAKMKLPNKGEGLVLLTNEDINYEIFKENNKIRIIEKRPDYMLITAYDGVESRSLGYIKDKNMLTKAFGSINNRFHYDIAKCDPSLFTNFYSERAILNLNTGNASIIESQEEDDVYMVKFSFDNGGLIQTFWFSEPKMFRPIKIIEERKDMNEVTNIEYMEKNGYFVPKNINRKKILLNGDIYSTSELTIKSDWIVNEDLSDTLFTINFPKGLEIYDHRIKKKIIVE